MGFSSLSASLASPEVDLRGFGGGTHRGEQAAQLGQSSVGGVFLLFLFFCFFCWGGMKYFCFVVLVGFFDKDLFLISMVFICFYKGFCRTLFPFWGVEGFTGTCRVFIFCIFC